MRHLRAYILRSLVLIVYHKIRRCTREFYLSAPIHSYEWDFNSLSWRSSLILWMATFMHLRVFRRRSAPPLPPPPAPAALPALLPYLGATNRPKTHAHTTPPYPLPLQATVPHGTHAERCLGRRLRGRMCAAIWQAITAGLGGNPAVAAR